ncbi:MAG: hypothetical protein HONDAALG_02640 [Gammaproteobacteria bacterium]|nr:hypothetical protein [Gammaproteobacteria bacterium]
MPRPSKIRNNPIRTTLLAWGLAAAGLCSITYKVGYYHSGDFWKNLVSGIHNTLFDILFIGILIFWLNRRGEVRIEVQRHREEIDLWRNDDSVMARKKNLISIRRLNEQGVYEIDLSNSGLQQVDLTGVKLIRSDLTQARCYKALFKDADFRYAIMDEINLKEAVLTTADLRRARLWGAMLEYADLQEADLRGADLTNANISNVIWKGAIYDNETKFPYDFDKSEMVLAQSHLKLKLL